nr:MAG: replication-associated protein [Canine associated porprismacovirus]
MDTWMVTAPADTHKREIEIMLEENDVKKYVVGRERGRGGYEHWQIRLQTSNKSFFDWMKANIPKAHCEQAQDTYEAWQYERKDGHFWSSDDTVEIRKVRFGQLTKAQKGIIQTLRSQNDRQVDVWYDPKGNHGKSWLTVHLYETGKALVVPRASTTADKLSAFICSAWKGEEIVIIDIPRASKPTIALYECIEEIKDGLVFDHRYSGRTRNIRGTKIAVFTNHKLDLKQLSNDRWRLHSLSEIAEGRNRLS